MLIKPSKDVREPVEIPTDPSSPNKMCAPKSSSVEIQKAVPSAKEWLKRSTLPPIINALDLMDEKIPMPPELIKGVLSQGSTMVYGGGSKTNKTFALLDLAISVAAGVPWWNMETTQGKVLYLDFELKKYHFQQRQNIISSQKNVSRKALKNLDVWNLRGYAQSIEELAPHILERVRDGDYKMIIIDPIYKVLGDRDENSAGDINSLMNELEAIAVESGAAIVVGHHFSKGGQAGKDSMDRISGSGVFARSPDGIVIITKHQEEDVYSVEMTLRDFKRVDPFCVEWDFPLMIRNEKLDPKKLRIPGKRVEEFTTDQLLEVLGEDELTTGEWKEACAVFNGMKDRTFSVKRRLLEDSEKIIKGQNGKWKVAPEPKSIPVKDITPPHTGQNKEVQQQQKPTAALIEPKLTKPDKVVQQQQNTSAAFIEV